MNFIMVYSNDFLLTLIKIIRNSDKFTAMNNLNVINTVKYRYQSFRLLSTGFSA